MLFDTHVHTRLSPDAEMDPVEAIAVLAQQGMGLCFTEHIDYVTPLIGKDPDASDAPRGKQDFLADITVYPETYRHLQSDTVGLGLEIGLTAAYASLNRQAAALDGLDFIIGSIHFVDGWDIYVDYFNHAGQYDHNGPMDPTQDDPYRRMLTYTREMIEYNDFFDTLGHIDYLSRYSPFKEKNVLYHRYPDEYDALFTALIERDKALEINTARLGDDDAVANWLILCKRFYALGGRFVTLGSDAHQPEALGRYFDRAHAIIQIVGLRPVYFKRRRMFYCYTDRH